MCNFFEKKIILSVILLFCLVHQTALAYEDKWFIVNEKIAKGLWFQADLKWYRSHWVNREKKNLFMGMEQHVIFGLGMFLPFNPCFDKE